MNKIGWILIVMAIVAGCEQAPKKQTNYTTDSTMVRLLTLDPGHFHAALVLKTKNPDIDTTVHVYAPEGAGLNAYQALIDQYNRRDTDPTNWNVIKYTNSDYAEKMLADKKGNVVVLSGNNRLKTDYIERSVNAGLNVLADKPMAIDQPNFQKLVKAFENANKNGVLLYDIMTERSEITNILQKELMHMPELFGELKKGSENDPAIFIESIHYFYKHVSGKPLVRPDWFFDPAQQGDAIADVGTHLVDLIQWQCFPNQSLDFDKDLNVYGGKIWPTPLTLSQFTSITGKNEYPGFLSAYIRDSLLNTHANGEMSYTIKDVHTKIIARWDYKAEEGGDVHYAIIKGTKANLEIKQTKAENFKPTLYINPADGKGGADFDAAVTTAIEQIGKKYEGVTSEKSGNNWKVVIPTKYDVGHEAHFAEVMERYLQYLKDTKLPDWEVPNMIAKYYTTTKALELATRK